jgi:hypothetical protein
MPLSGLAKIWFALSDPINASAKNSQRPALGVIRPLSADLLD